MREIFNSAYFIRFSRTFHRESPSAYRRDNTNQFPWWFNSESLRLRAIRDEDQNHFASGKSHVSVTWSFKNVVHKRGSQRWKDANLRTESKNHRMIIPVLQDETLNSSSVTSDQIGKRAVLVTRTKTSKWSKCFGNHHTSIPHNTHNHYNHHFP